MWVSVFVRGCEVVSQIVRVCVGARLDVCAYLLIVTMCDADYSYPLLANPVQAQFRKNIALSGDPGASA